jgi:hypothetical protein
MNINHGVRNSIYCTLRHEPLSYSAPQRTESRAPCRGRGGLTNIRDTQVGEITKETPIFTTSLLTSRVVNNQANPS